MTNIFEILKDRLLDDMVDAAREAYIEGEEEDE